MVDLERLKQLDNDFLKSVEELVTSCGQQENSRIAALSDSLRKSVNKQHELVASLNDKIPG